MECYVNYHLMCGVTPAVVHCQLTADNNVHGVFWENVIAKPVTHFIVTLGTSMCVTYILALGLDVKIGIRTTYDTLPPITFTRQRIITIFLDSPCCFYSREEL